MKSQAVRYVGAALLAGSMISPITAYASTAANTSITNTVTVNFDDAAGNAQTAVTASVSFSVNLVASAPILSAPADVDPATESTLYNQVYTVTGTANGNDTYNITNASVNTNMDGDPAFGGDASIVLGGTTTAAAITAGATTFTVPFDGTDDSEVNLIAVGDTIVLDPTGVAEVATVTAIDESTGAASNTATITVSAALANSYAAALIIGEQGTATITVTTDTVTTPPSGTHNVTVTYTSAADAGVTADDSVLYTVYRAALTVTKYVRNVTDPNFTGTPTSYVLGGQTYYDSSVNGSPGDTMEYLVVVENPVGYGDAQNIVVSDPVPQFTTYVANSIQMDVNGGGLLGYADTADNGDAAETDGSTIYVYAGVGGDDTAAGLGNGTGGTLAGGENASVLFQVTID